MNQPLTVIRLTIQNCLAQLEDAQDLQEVVDDLKDCLDEVSTTSSIVDRFKGFARQSSRTRSGKTSLQSVAERVVRVWNDAAKRRNVSLVLEGLDQLGGLYVDERDMEQVFFSLVENAIQAADGTANHHLTITGTAKDKSVELRFADDCGGIAPENVDRVFDPFFTTKSRDEGTGLGLCIVEQALSRVRGKIHAENRPGEGVTFVITLPLGNGR
jgi:C4-dicarboxylate-specific signal transduction histidine kinase